MTGGKAILVKTSTTNAKTTLNLYVYYKISQNIETNKSAVNCGMYITLSAGSIGPWTDSNGSYLGTKTNTFAGSIPNTNGALTYWIVENKSFTVDHNADGTGSATIYWKWGVNSSWGGMVKPSGSFTITLPTIPRASSITSVGNITLGTPCSVKWTPASANFKYKLKFSLGDWNYTTDFISPKTTNTYTYTGYTVPANDTLYKLIPKATGKMSVTLTTYNSDGKQIGSTSAAKSFTVAVPNTVVPTMGNIELTPSDFLVQGRDKLTISVSGCEAGAGSSIKSYTFVGPGISITTTNTSIVSNSVVSDVGELSYVVKVTDNRDRTAIGMATIVCHPYSAPYFKSFDAYRVSLKDDDKYIEDESGEYIKCTYDIVYSYVNGNNTASLSVNNGGAGEVEYEQLSTPTVGDGIAIVTGSALIKNANPNKTYKISAVVEDGYLNGNLSPTKTVFSKSRIFNIRTDGNGMALGKMAESSDVFDVAWNGKFRKNMFVGDKSEYNDGNTGVCINPEGHIHLQCDASNSDGPSVSFYLGNNTEPTTDLRLNPEDKQMYLGNYKLNAVKPYYEKGDTINTMRVKTSGYITASKKSVNFIVPLSKPVIGNPTVTVTTTRGYLLRQNDKFTNGSAWVSQTDITYAELSEHIGTLSPCGNLVNIIANFKEDTNVTTNNAPIGVDVELSITFS